MEGLTLLFECNRVPDGDHGFYKLYHHADEDGGPGSRGDDSPAEDESEKLDEKLINPYGILEIANKAFGFTPTYTMWGLSNQTLNSIMIESGYRIKESSKLKDEHCEYEWIETESFDGEKRKVKKYKDQNAV